LPGARPATSHAEAATKRWTWRGGVRPTERLRAIVDQLLSRIDMDARGVAARRGRRTNPLGVRVACCDAHDVESLERSGLVVVGNDNGERVVRSAHPLYQELTRADLPLTHVPSQMWRLAEEYSHTIMINAAAYGNDLSSRFTWGMSLPPFPYQASCER